VSTVAGAMEHRRCHLHVMILDAKVATYLIKRRLGLVLQR